MDRQQIKYLLANIFKHPYKIPHQAKDYIDQRYQLIETFQKAPALKAVLDTFTSSVAAAEMVAAMIANKDFSVLGTNMTTALATLAATGGVTITTAGASADSAIILPSLSTKQTAWSSTLWSSDKSLEWECCIVTGASVALTSIWAGLKLTNTPVVATDDDQCFFRYDAATAGGAWQIITSRAGTDTTTTVAVGTSPAVLASTKYRLRIQVSSGRTVRFWINDIEILYNGFGSVFPALTTGINFIPYVGVLANTAAAKAITVRGQILSRLI
jgi:hypothetical protein